MDAHASHHGHASHLDLMPVGDDGAAIRATHVAVNNGDWFNPSTWADGEVPGDGAMVHIPAGVSVAYEGASDAALFMVRVDGKLDMYADNGTATKMVVDTLLTSAGSALNVEANNGNSGTVDVVFAEGTPPPEFASHYKDTSDGDGVLGRSSWDPDQLSLGLVAEGDVNIQGQAVDGNMRLAEGPAAGAAQLVFDLTEGEDPGWAAGQKIVVGGSDYLGHDETGDFQTQDEVRSITNVEVVNGQMIVTIDAALAFDHIGPNDHKTGAEITGFVGNLSRNVTFSSAVADQNGDGAADRGTSHGDQLGADDHAVTERGHIMFMHNDDVAVVNSAFFGLGRTDKSKPVDDFVTGGASGTNRLHVDVGELGAYDPHTDTALETAAHLVTNERGRYPLHIHQAGVGGHDHHGDHDHDEHEHDHDHESGGASHGVIGPCPETGCSICMCGDQDGDGIEDCKDDDYFDVAYLAGNVVWGSPGWGYVHHSSHAKLEGNLAFDIGGASFVAESGNETGQWQDNLAIGTSGFNITKIEDSDQFNDDDGGEGVGFYLRSRGLDVEDNTAHSSARAGFYYHNNGVDFQDTQTSSLSDELDGVGHGLDAINTEDVPIRVFEGNTTIAAKEGLRIATDPLDSVRKFSDAWSHLKDFTATAVDEAGVSITYSSKYIFENFQLYGTEEKVTPTAQMANAGFYFKASVADITIVDSHVETFSHAFTNWNMVGNRQEYRRGYWDPKSPAGWHPTERYEGMGTVEGIENPAHNLWNANLVNLTYSDIASRAIRSFKINVETETGVTESKHATITHSTSSIEPPVDGLTIELLDDSRDGGLVALWREDIKNHPDQKAMLLQHIPLAYQETVYLSQVHLKNGGSITRSTYEGVAKGINDDIWSGTALEFAKEDSLGRHVFMYNDFSPVDPSKIERAVTTNEKLLFTKDMIDGVLATDGYVMVAGITSVKFVVMNMAFTDRLTGEIETKKFLVALDLQWELPEGTMNAGLLNVSDDLIVAEQYLVFSDGLVVPGAAPIVIDGFGDITIDGAEVGRLISDGDDELSLGEGEDTVDAAGGNDLVLGRAAADHLGGGQGEDALFGGDGFDQLFGGDGADFLDGEAHNDRIYGGDGADRLEGGAGRDQLFGGEGSDELLAGVGADVIEGGAGNDILDGQGGNDKLSGGTGHDHIIGGTGTDRLLGQSGDDVVSGGGGADALFGGSGSDLMNGGSQDDEISGGSGDDILLGASGHDSIKGDVGADILNGGDGHDEVDGGEGNDLLEGDSGRDRLTGDEGSDALFGGGGFDKLFGNAEGDELFGGDSKDQLFGGSGDDNLSGDKHNDHLFGGMGNDRLAGGSGNDQSTGGIGADVFTFDGSGGNDVITDFEDGIDAIEFMIDSFGFEDLEIRQRREDTVITYDDGVIRLKNVDADVIDINDFHFLS